jgi:hypothetical protein
MDELEEVRAGRGVAVAGCSWDRWKEGGGAVRTVVVATWEWQYWLRYGGLGKKNVFFFFSYSTNRISVNTAFLVLIFVLFEPPYYYLSNGTDINPMPTLFAPPRDALHFFYPLCLSSTCFLSFSLYQPYICQYCFSGVDFHTIRTALLLSI